MIPHKLNRGLIILAFIGIILYFSAAAVSSLLEQTSMEEDTGVPAVSPEQAKKTALSFLSDRFGVKEANADLVYETEKLMSGYVEKHNLSETYRKTYEEKVPLDFWLVTLKTSSPDHTYTVKVGLDKGAVTAWKLETPLGPHDEKGLVIAKKALHDGGYNPDDWVYAPKRSTTENIFVFEEKASTIGEARMQIQVGVKNGQAVSFTPGFHVPESYVNWIGSQETAAHLMTFGSFGLNLAMTIAALVYVVKYAKDISFIRGLFLSLLVLILYIFQNLNIAPGLIAEGGETADDFMTWLTVVLGLLTAGSMWLSLLAGDQQWRMKGWNPWPRWRDERFGREVFYGMGRGYMICLFILGIQQVLFLAAGKAFDSFAINDPTQSVYNMVWPSLFPTLAWLAGISEEIVYRLLGIILFKKLLRVQFLAVLVPSVIWALGHTAYTIYPSYTRLVEVTVLGLIFGYTFLRYGLITAIFAHISMDSILMGLSLIVSLPDPFHILTGLFYIGLPAGVGYVIRFLHPRFGKKLPDSGSPHHLPEPRLMP